MTANNEGYEGSARILGLREGDNLPTAINEIILLEGENQYDATNGWTDLGVTMRGFKVIRDYEYEEAYFSSSRISEPITSMRVKTQVAEAIPGLKHLGTRPTIAFLVRDSSSKNVYAYIFRRCLRVPSETMIDFSKSWKAIEFPIEFIFEDGVMLHNQHSKKSFDNQLSFHNFDEWVVSLVKQT
jgi:hypothetical protein